MSITRGQRNAILPQAAITAKNRALHSTAPRGGVTVRCVRCGRSDGIIHSIADGKYLCKQCLQAGVLKKKVVIIGKDLWDRYMASMAEAKEREKLLQYLLDKNANISDATQMDICDKVIAARLNYDAALREVQDIAMTNGAIGSVLQFGPSAYQITITV